jgi:hypothetical protein
MWSILSNSLNEEKSEDFRNLRKWKSQLCSLQAFLLSQKTQNFLKSKDFRKSRKLLIEVCAFTANQAGINFITE